MFNTAKQETNDRVQDLKRKTYLRHKLDTRSQVNARLNADHKMLRNTITTEARETAHLSVADEENECFGKCVMAGVAIALPCRALCTNNSRCCYAAHTNRTNQVLR